MVLAFIKRMEPFFTLRNKLPLQIVQITLIITVISLSGAQLLLPNRPPGRSTTMGLGMRFRRWRSLKAYFILNAIEVVFWAAVAFMMIRGNSSVCIGTSCALGWVVFVLAGILSPLAKYLAVVCYLDEVRQSLELSIPSCEEWTEVNIHHSLLRIIGMVSGRVFIGPELCRSEQYLDAAINYTMEVMGAQRAVQNMRPWLRPFLAQSQPEVKELYQRIAEAEAFLQPVVKSRIEAMADLSYEKPDDFLQWLIDGKDKFPDKDSQNLAKVQLGLTFVAVHTTILTATNAFYDLAAMLDLQAELRDEVREVLLQSGGVFTSNVLQGMKKMDSFLKETLRVHPTTMASFQRKVLKPFTLSNGQVIPAGLMIAAVAVNSDPFIFPRADEFDPLRFYRLRTQAKDEGSVEKAANNQFVSVNQSSLTFGYGRHACPGRFFAANEIKMILAHALLRYDVKLVGSETKRYPNMEFTHMSIPDPSRKLLFKAIGV
ncbi:unnamed protein product [Fusarium equiseti]|uniref:Cytochrome P450 n=1 Tax=Fusarium equiseti TaxID=61235 RepID=A0A8J2NHW7_FUSEQ|nr:unnamed protein product [Fusarium equiseti]